MDNVTIFSIDDWGLLQTATGFEASWADSYWGKEILKGIGCYKDKLEPCYIVDHKVFNKQIWGNPSLKNQESVLHVVRGTGYLEYLSSGKWVTLGGYKEGKGPDGWTYFEGKYFHF